MERNNVVTALAHAIIVAESDNKGGTWEGANGAIKHQQALYVRQPDDNTLPGNQLLMKMGGIPLSWPTQNLAHELAPLLKTSDENYRFQQAQITPASQLSLLAVHRE